MWKWLLLVLLIIARGSGLRCSNPLVKGGMGRASKLLAKTEEKKKTGTEAQSSAQNPEKIFKVAKATTSTIAKTTKTAKEGKAKKTTTKSNPKLSSSSEELLLSLLQQALELTNTTVDDLLDNIKERSNRHNPGPSTDGSQLLDSVIRVYCTHTEPNFAMPWQRAKQDFSTSSGFVILGQRILTNAHSVEYSSLVQVKKRQSEDKFVATVVAIGHECDLAILAIEDPLFWKDLHPLPFGELPDLFEDVSVVGYPVGGDSISISSGVVSRIEMQEYAQASAELLAIQIDAAINPGNSGGPVVDSENRVIGVAFQSLSEEDIENIGYVVPVNVINHFLDDVAKHSKFSGVCSLGVRLQGMENSDLRKFYKLKPNETGVLVLGTAPLSPAAQVLHKGDVILAIDGIRVSNDATIPFRKGSLKERVQLSYYITQKFADESVKLRVLRNGSRAELPVQLWVPRKLVPRILLKQSLGSRGVVVGGSPSYLMIGGLVMVALSREYLQVELNPEHMTNFDSWAEEYKLLAMADETCKEDGQEVVLLSQVISHSCNIGYEMQRNMRLLSFNGIAVKNLQHLHVMIEGSRQGLTDQVDARKSISKELRLPFVFEFSGGPVIVLDGHAAFNAQEEICKEHFLPSSCSSDLLT